MEGLHYESIIKLIVITSLVTSISHYLVIRSSGRRQHEWFC